MLLFHSPSHNACGCLAILSIVLALSGSLARSALARSMASDSGSTQSLTPANGLPFGLLALGGSSMGKSTVGSWYWFPEEAAASPDAAEPAGCCFCTQPAR